MSPADTHSVPVTAGEPATSKTGAPANYRPTWLPDSTRVAFLSSDGERTRLAPGGRDRRAATESLMDLGPESCVTAPPPLRQRLLDFRLSPDAGVVAFSDVDPDDGTAPLFRRRWAAAKSFP
jgi:hypothetical protein